MKIKAIESICKSEKRITVFSDCEAGVQWIGVTGAMYPLYSMPVLSEKTVFTMFDIPEDSRGKIRYSEEDALPAAYDYSDYTKGEVELLPSRIGIQYSGITLLPLRTPDGILYINKAYLAPFADSKNGIRLSEREDKNGGRYLAVKDGMLLVGILLPYNITDPAFSDELNAISSLTSRTMNNLQTQMM